ncbi:hypothetical protein [Streptomyces anulatus]|uniref:hypothetical protein n=1 Tax=Streptomyces anulatus TaxID=1892 RepID=UPI00365E3944
MSTMPKLPVQFYDTHGVPTPPNMSREHMVDLTRAAYERSNVYLDRDVVDIHLAEVADQAACSLLRDRWKHDFPVAAYTELLATVSALRSILGYAQSPTAGDVSAWARRLWESSAAAAGDDKDFHEVQIHGGPYNEVVVVLWGPKTPQAPGMLVGPPLTLELATERGDSENLEYGTVHYKRLNRRPAQAGAQWEYWLDSEYPRPAEGARPHMLAPQTDRAGKGGRA